MEIPASLRHRRAAQNEPSVDAGPPALVLNRDFRQALGFFPTGVAIITTVTAGGDRIGVTVSSFNSVSLHPPLILFSLARRLASFEAWRSIQYFAVNLLGKGQHGLSNQFARAQSDKWQGVAVTAGHNGIPLLQDAPANFECDLYARHNGGDHEIIIGRVVAFQTAAKSQEPLIFYSSNYRELDKQYGEPPSEQALTWLYGW